MLIIIITLIALLALLVTFGCEVINANAIAYDELNAKYESELEENRRLEAAIVRKQAIVSRKDEVIAELEKIKGVAVSEVTYYAPTGNHTATGTAPQEGRTIAVDPNLIPLGSDVYVQGHGWMKAEDTGGAIDGTDVDVFVGSEAEAQRGGRVARLILWRDSND